MYIDEIDDNYERFHEANLIDSGGGGGGSTDAAALGPKGPANLARARISSCPLRSCRSCSSAAAAAMANARHFNDAPTNLNMYNNVPTTTTTSLPQNKVIARL